MVDTLSAPPVRSELEQAVHSYKYGCLLLPLPHALSRAIVRWTRDNVPPEHLGPGGYGDEPHVTLKYGFGEDTSLPGALGRFLIFQGGIEITLTGASRFPAGEDGVPLKLDVKSERLQELYREISATFEADDKWFPNYRPHVTLAYLRPEVSHLYARIYTPFEGAVLTLTQAAYVSPQGTTHRLPLTGAVALKTLSEVKTMSSVDVNSGGALVPPPAFPKRKFRPVYTPSVKAMVEKKNKLGHRLCHDSDTGKRVPCPPKVGTSPKKPKATKQDKEAAIGKLIAGLKDPSVQISKEDIGEALAKMTKEDILKIKKEFGFKVASNSKKAELINKVVELAFQMAKIKPLPPAETPPEETTPETPPEATPPGEDVGYEEVQEETPEEFAARRTKELMQTDPDHPMAKRLRDDQDNAEVVRKFVEQTVGLVTGKETSELIKAHKEALDAAMEYNKGKLKPGFDPKQAVQLFEKAKELNAKKVEATKRRNEDTAKARKLLRDMIKARKPIEIKFAVTPKLKFKNDAERLAIQGGLSFAISICEGAGTSLSCDLSRSSDGRAYYTGTGGYNKIAVGGSGDDFKTASVMSHEMGHLIERRKPEVEKLVREFLTYRIAGEKEVDMATVPGGAAMKGEKVRKDNFDRFFHPIEAYYCGKNYDKKDGTYVGSEVLSMGLEALYKDPAGFMKSDPEYAQFVISCLRMP